MKKLVFLLLIVTFFFSCKTENKVEHVERAFYYWKNDSSLNYQDAERVNSLKVNKLYVKYFEIDYNDAMGNFPFAKNNNINYEVNNIQDLTIIPTIYVKNEIFKFNTEKTLDVLADNIVFLVDKYNKEIDEKVVTNTEIQIDCDWTASTKDKYFYLLKKIKEISKREISCTLRLYPYKYPDKMGVPPVDKVTLMCYNLIKPLSEKEKNSILDYDELKLYLDTERTYPVHTDIALPIFFWSHLYQANQFTEVLKLNSKQVQGFAKPLRPMWYEVTKDTVIDYDTYLRKGDKIKCEEVSAETLNKTIALIKKNVALDATTTISLFHIDNDVLNQYSNEELSAFFDSFSK